MSKNNTEKLHEVMTECSDANDFDKVKRLIRNGADVNGKDDIDRTPLHLGKKNQSHPKVTALLIAHGADVNAVQVGEVTPLMVAAEQGRIDDMNILIGSGANVNAVDYNGNTALGYAVLHNNEKAIDILITNGIDVSQYGRLYGQPTSALHKATTKENHYLVERLIHHGASVNVKDSDGITPLHFAAALGNTDILNTLIEHGANIEANEAWHGQTPLFIAGRALSQSTTPDKHEKIIKTLLDHGANISATDEFGNTILHDLYGFYYQPAETVQFKNAIKFLVKNGIDIEAVNQFGDTALTNAINNNLPVDMALLKHNYSKLRKENPKAYEYQEEGLKAAYGKDHPDLLQIYLEAQKDTESNLLNTLEQYEDKSSKTDETLNGVSNMTRSNTTQGY